MRRLSHAADLHQLGLLSPALADTGLTDDEITKVVAFLRTLTSEEPLERPLVP